MYEIHVLAESNLPGVCTTWSVEPAFGDPETAMRYAYAIAHGYYNQNPARSTLDLDQVKDGDVFCPGYTVTIDHNKIVCSVYIVATF